jgi:hypothetical protein
MKYLNKTCLFIILSLHILNANQFQFLENIADSSDFVVLFQVKESKYTETYKYLKNGMKLITNTFIAINGYPEKIIKGNDIFSKQHMTKISFSNSPVYLYDSLGNVIGNGWRNNNIKRSGEEFSTLPDSCYLLFFNITLYDKDTVFSLIRVDIKEHVCALKPYIKNMNDIKSYCKCVPGILTGETTADEELKKLKQQMENVNKD